MRIASPSAMAVLPTPGSPMSTGLFFCLRARIWMVRSSSSSLPTSGSMAPSAAAFVRSLPNCSSIAPLPCWPFPPFWVTLTSSRSSFSCSSFVISSGTLDASTPSFSRALDALPPSSFMRASRMCSVSMPLAFTSFASSTPSFSTRFAAGVKGISTETFPEPRPIISSTALRRSLSVTPSFFKTFAARPVFSAMTPTRSISVPT
mmetsp:Transcript_4000/g.11702  ORF Transcript_4000/g.11702 Transcript_4000/m.11702 type:complete len:204 (+) Transcript_4000:173-784(+)